MEPPGKENATGEGGALRTDYDAQNVAQAECRVNGKDAPPNGYAFADTREGEAKRLEPIVEHQTLLPEPETLTRERIALRAMMQWVLLCDGHRGKVTAFYFLIGEDTRRPGEIALALGITRKTFENYRAECRIWFDGFIAGLESEAFPSSGAALP